MSEGERSTAFTLIASIGGIFGLFIGLSGVTLFEILEALGHAASCIPALIMIARAHIRAAGRRRLENIRQTVSRLASRASEEEEDEEKDHENDKLDNKTASNSENEYDVLTSKKEQC
ncbi:unnamed protein product [Protopolystoma xenopodis]|uniref:Uncharacterized protein n=1 Tax=Protopolystoma xenopodis TaxID=117903 RepID=A0A3S4ZXY5_9PLAT|nr:unnamed protein product [Protopolystoma xenopodis]